MSVKTIIERFLLLWLTLLAVAAYYWPTWFPGLPDPLLEAGPYKKYVFSVTMLAIGSLLPRDEVRDVFRRWPAVLGGTTIQYISMPLLAYACGRMFGLDQAWMIGIIMVGCVPGAMASNVLTLAARGNVSYSVSLTTSATLFSPLVVPFTLWVILSQWPESKALDPLRVFWLLCWMVVIPVVAGHLLALRFSLWAALAKRFAAIVANLTILWIIAVVIADNRDKLSDLTWQILLALLALNLLGYLAGYFGGFMLRIPDSMRRALTLEIGMQNAGLGAVLAAEIFGRESPSAIPPALYTFGCMFTGTILARLWAELSERNSSESS